MRILNTIGKNFNPEAKKILAKIGKVDYKCLPQKDLKKEISKYDIIVVGLGLNFNKEVLKYAESLKVLATATTGLDHIDLDYCKKKNIEVLSLKGEDAFLKTITGTAELAFGLMIFLARKIPQAFESVKKGEWHREKFEGNNFFGKTLGIAGFGRLGGMMAKYGNAFGMNVIAFDPFAQASVFKEKKVKKVSFKELLSKSDFLSIHAHLTVKTKGMFARAQFLAMKKTAFLINTSRGEIVNEKDLIYSLKRKEIAGYATDVLCGEIGFSGDSKQSLLRKYAKEFDNVIITPHIGGMTFESRLDTDLFISNKALEYIKKSY